MNHQFYTCAVKRVALQLIAIGEQFRETLGRACRVEIPQRPVVQHFLSSERRANRLRGRVNILRNPNLPYPVSPLQGFDNRQKLRLRMNVIVRIEMTQFDSGRG